MLSSAGVNAILDAAVADSDFAYIETHSDYCGADGSLNAHSGGTPAHARKAVSWGAAASKSISQSGTASVDIPNGSDYAWLSLWSASSGGTCAWICPRNGQAQAYYVDPSTDTFYCPAHGFMDDDTIVFYTTAPTGVTAGTVYYVITATTNTFQISTSISGSAVDVTDWPADANALVSAIDIDPDSGQRVATIQNMTVDIARAGVPG